MFRKLLLIFFILTSFLGQAFGAETPDLGIEIVTLKSEEYSGGFFLKIPKGYYLYANPKGQGTGKPTEIILKGGGSLSMKVDYPRGVEYNPGSGMKSVMIYRGTMAFPFTLKGNSSGKIEIFVDALMCSSSACIPIKGAVEFEVIGGGSGLTVKNKVTAELGSELNSESTGLFSIGGGVNSEIKDEFTPVFIQKEVGGILQAILFGIIAGFLLNLMPCVLPVVGIKVMALLEHAGKERRSVFIHAGLFSGGIFSSFLVLAALAAFGGQQWGGLFQNRLFLIFMICFVFFMSLSMFGLFTLNIPGFAARASRRDVGGYFDSFIKGLIATLLATPCSGPFLGAVLAWSLLQSPIYVFAVFLSIGFGMALPYGVLVIKPELLKLIPASGPWMVKLERAMGILLMGTVIYLLTVLKREDAYSAITAMLIWGVLMLSGRSYLNSLKGKLKKYLPLSATVIIIVLSFGMVNNFIFHDVPTDINRGNSFSYEKITENSSSGKISIVEFTADWCPNCKALELAVLNSSDVKEIAAESEIDFMVADITVEKSSGEKFLKRLGGRSIPFLAVFPYGNNFRSPVCLRDIYSVSDFKRAVQKARSMSVN